MNLCVLLIEFVIVKVKPALHAQNLTVVVREFYIEIEVNSIIISNFSPMLTVLNFNDSGRIKWQLPHSS